MNKFDIFKCIFYSKLMLFYFKMFLIFTYHFHQRYKKKSRSVHRVQPKRLILWPTWLHLQTPHFLNLLILDVKFHRWCRMQIGSYSRQYFHSLIKLILFNTELITFNVQLTSYLKICASFDRSAGAAKQQATVKANTIMNFIFLQIWNFYFSVVNTRKTFH